MQFRFTDDQEFLRDAVRQAAGGIFDSTTVRSAMADDGDAVRAGLWNTIVELGWAGVLVPEELGGSGGSVVDACIIAEELAAVLAPVPFVGTAIATTALLTAMDDRDGLSALASGHAMSLAVDRRLRWPGTSLAFDWLPGAQIVQIGPNQVHRWDRTPTEFDRTDLLHPCAVLDGLEHMAPPAPETVRRAIATARVGVAAALTGLAIAALNEAVDYAKEREQYGRPIGHFQAIQHMCADMFVDVEASRSMVYGAAWTVEHESDEEAERVAAAAVGWCVPSALRTVETGIQVLGGIGVTWEHDAHLRLRHAHLLARVLGGTDDAYELLVATATNADAIH